MRKAFILLVFVLFIGVSFAFELDVPTEPVSVSIGTSQLVDIKVSSAMRDVVIISILDQKPWMLLENSQLSVSSEEKTSVLTVTPRGDVPVGLYKVRVSVLSLETGEKKYADIYLSVKRGNGLNIEKTLVTGNLEPTGTVVLRSDIKNYGTATYHSVSLNVTVKSPLRTVYSHIEPLTVNPDETETTSTPFQLVRNIEPGDYVAEIILMQNDKVLDSTAQRFTVAQKAVISQEIRYTPTGFGYEKLVKLRNDGNTGGDAIFVQQMTPIETFFFTGYRPTTAEDNAYSWDFRNLQPADTVTIDYRIDYSPLIIGLITFAGLVLFYFWKFRTVRIRKYIMQKKYIKEGEEFTVGVEIKNSSGKSATEIIIKDFVPSVFETKDGEGLKPAKRKTPGGTELTWRLAKLRSSEEILVSYRVMPVVGVHGTITLPRAAVDFKINGKERANGSGHAFLGIDMKSLPGLDKVFRKKK